MKRESLIVTCLGLNHRTAPVEERERFAFTPQELPTALVRLKETLGAAVILSTCNRTELYVTASDQPAVGDFLLGQLGGCKGVQADPSKFYLLRHADAVRHLFQVAAGVDSLVLGESQILGQVRDALSEATQAGTLNGVLSRVFHSALSVGKRARSETNIGRYAVSISSAAVTLARKTLGSLADKTVLIVSAGSTGKLAAKSLARSGAARILVTNRTPERAAELAAGVGGSAVAFSRLPQALAEADIVISGTGAESFLLGPELVRPALARRNGRSLLLIDIAVPRDVDPAVRGLPGVRLYDIDDIEAVAQANLRGRQREVQRVVAIAEEEVESFLEWWRSLDLVPVVAALRQRAEEIRSRELQRTLRRLPELTEDEQARIEAMTKAIVKKMLDRPIARLKDGADTGLYIEALQDLFEVRPGGAGLR